MDKRTILLIILLAASFYVIQLFFPQRQIRKTYPEKISQVTHEKPLEKKTFIEKGTKEVFYVLENDFQQLVFSSKGGSLTEINLPFKSKKNKYSVVNEIKFDKELKNVSKPNATFPLHTYNTYEDGKIIQKKGSLGGYNPLLRRQIIGSENFISPKLYALNIVSEYEDIENANYDLVRLEKDVIEFEITLPDRKIIKTYKFAKDAPYTFDLNISIQGSTKNLWITSGVPEVELTSGRNSPILKIKTYRKQKNVVDKLSLPKTQNTVSSIYPDWICNSNGFFGLIIDPLTEIAPGYRSKYIAGQSFPTRLSLIDPQYKLYPATKYPGYEMFLPLKSNNKKISFTKNYRCF